MVNKLYVAKSPNLSLAWAEVLLHLLDRGVTNLSPAVITNPISMSTHYRGMSPRSKRL